MDRINRRRITTVIIATAAIIAVVAFYATVDPAEARWAPRCMLRTLTGFDCPGCGFQRAAHAMLHGDFASAWHYNPFLFFILPVGVAYWLIELSAPRFPRIRRVMFAPGMLVGIVVVTVAWWVLRNICY